MSGRIRFKINVRDVYHLEITLHDFSYVFV